MNFIQVLILEDIDDVKLIYIVGIIINKWCCIIFLKEFDYEFLIMLLNGIECFDWFFGELEFDGKLMLIDIFLLDVMVILVVVVDYYMGVRESDDVFFRDLKVMFGVVMGIVIFGDV